MDREQREKQFILGLEKLSRETKLKIFGCGCCGSPCLEDLEESELTENAGYSYGYNGELSWIIKK